jgi:hypothetical protein
MTVFHTEIIFSEDEFKTLYLLAANGEKPLTFDNLYDRVWDKGDGVDRRDEALNGINDIMEHINAIDPTMLWIEYKPETGYTFRLHEVYHPKNRVTQENTAELPGTKKKVPARPVVTKYQRRDRRIAAIAACAAVIVIGILAIPGLFPLNGIVIDEEKVPLAAPDFGNDVVFPFITDVTIPADTAEVQIPLHNPEGNGCDFIFEIALADTGETLYISGPVEPGAAIESIRLTKGLPKGVYKARLIISAVTPWTADEIESTSIAFDIIAL